MIKKRTFYLEGVNGEYPGVDTMRTWNGWACPLFDYNTAVKILNASIHNGFRWYYDRSTDRFIVWNISDDLFNDWPEEYSGAHVPIDGELINMYSIGARSWIWSILEDLS